MFPRRLRQMSAYTVVRRVHLCLAMMLGGLFVLTGLSGSVLVFDHAIDEALNPSLLTLDAPVAESQRLSYDALLEKARAYALSRDYYVSGFTAPRHAASTQLFWMKPRNEPGMVTYELYLNPLTGEVLGQRQWGEYLTSFLYMFHHTLWLGKPGKLTLGFSAIGMVVLLLTGLYIWWPRGQGRHQWKAALSIKSKAGLLRRLFDLHRVAGIYGLIVLLVVVCTGIYMVFPDTIRSWTAGATPPVSLTRLDTPAQADMTVAETFALARKELPESSFSRLYTGDGTQAWLMTFATEEDPRDGHGYNRLSIHPGTHGVLAKRRWSDASTADRFFGWMFPLHNGEALGMGGRVVVFIAGFLPTVLMVTGIWRWLRKRAKKVANREG